MSEIRRESAEGKELRSSKAKTKLSEEVLASIQGAGWCVANDGGIDANDPSWQDGLFEVWVVWREAGRPDRWCTVESHTNTNGRFTYFDLYCPDDGYIYYNVPASQVLVEYAD